MKHSLKVLVIEELAEEGEKPVGEKSEQSEMRELCG